MAKTPEEFPELKKRFEAACRELEAFQRWASQAPISTRIEFGKHQAILLQRRDSARQCLDAFEKTTADLYENLKTTTQSALAAFEAAIWEAKRFTLNAKPRPPFIR